MAYKKKTGGRKIGTPNKISGDLKAMILQALEEAGGVEYLKQQAMSNDTSFNTLLGKVLPMTVDAGISGKIIVAWEK